MGRTYRPREPSPVEAWLRASIPVLAIALASAAPLAPAAAADLGVPGPAYYPAKPFPPPAIYDWTGIYVGGNIGGGILTDSASQNGVSVLPGATNLVGSANLSPAGVIGGGQIGANYEFAPWVVGIEGSWDASAVQGNTLTGIASTTPIVFPPPSPPPTQERFTSNVLWLAALTGRVGYAANDWLFYGKAGGAWMRVTYTEDLLNPGNVGTQDISDSRTGFTIGAGIEIGLVENISAKIEYDFYDFGSRNYNFVFTPVSVRSDLHTLTVGLNYKFNWSGGPKP
jgi:outer membrane immunogenic protein